MERSPATKMPFWLLSTITQWSPANRRIACTRDISVRSSGRLTDVQSYTPLYQRYAGAVRLSRVYVRPDQAEAARVIVSRLTGALA